MRVISGSAKGITLTSVPGKSTRPITDRVKEALFNILGPTVYDTRWLDLFGGTGAVGIEALSRGADSVVFTEINYRAYKIINQNLEATKLADYAEVLKMDAFTYLHGEMDEDFDVVYVAPPQYKGIWIKAMQALDENPDWVHPKGSVIVQIHPKEFDSSIGYTNFKEFDQRDYGDTRLIFYHRTSAE
ncbi:16S rRNA (guanine(966)-N(2))-methyltransferase RsmD [bacterium]|nr:16S rRNA (guanine(966)-N(2))-methyltransferase RsmD [bacterium]